MKAVILQSNYIPWRGYFDLIRNCDVFIFYDEVKYTKNDWRNRNQVVSSKGNHWITIPVSADSVKLKISEVTLDYNNSWRSSHISLLDNCYLKAPNYKKYLKPLFQSLLFETPTNYLGALNQQVIRTLSAEMGIKTSFRNSSEFTLEEGRVDRLIHLLKEVGATEYISGPAAKGYLEGSHALFEENNIKLTFFDYPTYKSYPTASGIYFPYASILDLLANVPKDEALEYFNGIQS